nr:hypothetical protein [Tanacetum cinerariifolium]
MQVTKERIFKDCWRFKDEEDDLDENLENSEEYEEDKANKILRVIHDKLNNDWFNNTSEDEDALEGSLYKGMEFEVSSTRVRVVERFYIGVTT